MTLQPLTDAELDALPLEVLEALLPFGLNDEIKNELRGTNNDTTNIS